VGGERAAPIANAPDRGRGDRPANCSAADAGPPFGVHLAKPLVAGHG